jgi:predicted small secreted protein
MKSRFTPLLAAATLLAACSDNASAGLGNDRIQSASTPLSIRVSVSGEKFAAQGFAYSSMDGFDDPVFVDGWEVDFEKYYISIANPRLNRPGADPSVRQNLGALVAQQNGPWIANVHAPGPDVGAAGPPEAAWPLFSFTQGTDGAALDPTVRYAFSYDMVPAVASATRVGVTGAQEADVQLMISHHWTSYVVGTATYRGRAPSATVDPTFQRYPRVVHFTWGWGAPARYLNCHNPALGEQDIPANRGVQPSRSASVRAQMTVHVDHFYWDTANVDTAPVHFDPIAARARMTSATEAEVTFDDLMGVSYSALTDLAGAPVLDRGAQTPGYTRTGQFIYQLNSASGITDLRSFLATDARTQGHMNAEGSCYVQPVGDITY